MKIAETMKILGIDNVFFEVGDLDSAIEFYRNLGLPLKKKFDHMTAALFSIGSEEPGLLIKQVQNPQPSRLWIEVNSALEAQSLCSSLGYTGNMLETSTGFTFEIADPWGNILGFADYSKKPEMGRK